MDGRIIFFIVLGILFLLYVLVLLAKVSYVKQREKELSGEPGVYEGPAGEPQWFGQLPAKVDDYVCPRYVYENLVESTDYLPENGRIIGYRISSDLVIHSRVQSCVKAFDVEDYVERLGGKLLTSDDVLTLYDNWKEFSALRVKAGDEALRKFELWCNSGGTEPVRANIVRKTIVLESVASGRVCASLILKR